MKRTPTHAQAKVASTDTKQKRGATAKKKATLPPATARKAAARKRPVAKKTAARKRPVAKKTAASKSAGAKKPTRQPATAKKAAKRFAARADLGAPTAAFFAKQPPHLGAILAALRELVEEVVPEAESSIKWGMPFYTVGGVTICALGAHRSHVNLILAGPPGTFSDPGGRLTGAGKTGRHLKLTALDQLPKEAVRGWLRAALALARSKP